MITLNVPLLSESPCCGDVRVAATRLRRTQLHLVAFSKIDVEILESNTRKRPLSYRLQIGYRAFPNIPLAYRNVSGPLMPTALTLWVSFPSTNATALTSACECSHFLKRIETMIHYVNTVEYTPYGYIY